MSVPAHRSSQQSEGRGISRHLESPGQKQLVGPVIASSAKPEGLNLYSKEKLGKLKLCDYPLYCAFVSVLGMRQNPLTGYLAIEVPGVKKSIAPFVRYACFC
jgi:hypothetical protein